MPNVEIKHKNSRKIVSFRAISSDPLSRLATSLSPLVTSALHVLSQLTLTRPTGHPSSRPAQPAGQPQLAGQPCSWLASW